MERKIHLISIQSDSIPIPPGVNRRTIQKRSDAVLSPLIRYYSFHTGANRALIFTESLRDNTTSSKIGTPNIGQNNWIPNEAF